MDLAVEMEKKMEEIIAQQEKTLLSLAKRFVPYVTAEDLLQPNDFPQLEENPHFRFEEGVLIGMRTMQTALRAAKNCF